MSNVPLVDLGWQHGEIADEVAGGFARVLGNTSFIGGRDVTEFETGVRRVRRRRALRRRRERHRRARARVAGLGVGPGDEVIVPANTFVATAEAVVAHRCSLVLVDVDDDTLLDDPGRRRDGADRPHTRRHPGAPLRPDGPVDEIRALVADRGILVLEDAAQSQGATRHGESRRQPRRRRRDELLPRQEPRGLRRRRCRPHRRRRPRAHHARMSQHGSAVRTTTRSWASTHASTPCRPSCCGEARPPRRLERAAPRRPPTATTHLLADVPDVRIPVDRRRQRARLAPLRRASAAARRGARAGCNDAASARRSTTRCRCTCTRRSRTSATARATSPWRRSPPTRS